MESGEHQVTVRVELAGERLAEAVHLTTGIHLDGEGHLGSVLAPRRKGSRLWEEARTILLEGSLGRFPMEAVDFKAAFGHLGLGKARWYLKWEPRRWDWAFMGNVQLFLNESDADLMAELHDREGSLLSAITSDVVRQMTSALVSSEDYRNEIEDLPTWTVGGVVRQWMEMAFPDDSIEVLAGLFHNDPGRFDARLQAVFGGGGH